MGGYGAAGAGANTELAVKFYLEVDNIALTAFEKIKVGDAKWGTIANRTGIDPLRQQEDSGLKKIQEVEFTKRHRVGGTDDIKTLYAWHENGSKDKRSGSVVYLDRDDKEIMRLNFVDGWIKKIQHPESDAESEDAAMEWVVTLSVGNGLTVG